MGRVCNGGPKVAAMGDRWPLAPDRQSRGASLLLYLYQNRRGEHKNGNLKLHPLIREPFEAFFPRLGRQARASKGEAEDVRAQTPPLCYHAFTKAHA